MLVIAKIFKKEEVNVVSSLDVAETFEKLHKDVLESIRGIQANVSIAEFSALFYESEYTASNGKKNPMYYMNRDGFTLLVMGYTGEKAMRFKLGYINQFNEMERMLQGKKIERIKGVTTRNVCTLMVKESKENIRLKGHAYSLYTDLVYRVNFGKSAKQLREKLGISKKDDLRDYFTQEELEKVNTSEMFVASMLGFGYGYDEIKVALIEKVGKLRIVEKDMKQIEQQAIEG